MEEQPVTPSVPHAMSAKTPPVGTKTQEKPQASLAELTKLYQLNVISKATLRQMVFSICPVNHAAHAAPVPSTPSVPDVVPVAKKDVVEDPDHGDVHVDNARPPVKRKLIEASSVSTPPKNKKGKKSRKGRSSPKTSQLRVLVKDTTRRRFFEQCLKLDSLLWKKKRVGKKKEQMEYLLFERAVLDPLCELYRAHPGALHSVSRNKLKKIIRWQVCFFCFCTANL